MASTYPEVRLLCFPYAGASAGVYARWKRDLAPWLRMVAADLPGHGRRLGERLETDIARLTADALHRLAGEFVQPFALFGHSLGAVLAFELAVALTARGVEPLALFVSGSPAPSRRDFARYARMLASGDLRSELAALEGTPREVLDDAELMELLLPVLWADFQVCASYRCPSERLVSCPLHVIGGDSDTFDPSALEGWRSHTSSTCSIDVLPGNHFFIHSQQARLLKLIQTYIAQAQRERQLRGISALDTSATPSPS